MSNVASSLALQRIKSLLDAHSFVELGALVQSRSTDFNLEAKKAASDGVIMGHGTIDGHLVFVFSQNPALLGGSVGEMHAKKICQIYDLALKMGAPVIGLLDSTGIRLQESLDALEALGSIYEKAVSASGCIPQIMAIFGSCGGGMSLIPSIADFTFLENKAKLFFNSANAIEGSSVEELDTSSADFQYQSGNVDFVGSEAEILASIRDLIGLMPGSNLESAVEECQDDLNRASDGLHEKREDARALMTELADGHSFFECRGGFASEMVTGFLRLGGITVGVFGNAAKDGQKAQITVNGAYKAADFVRFCDAFDIPLLSLTNVASYEASVYAEKALGQALARLVFALSSADVGKVNVITKDAIGSAYLSMNAKAIGADLTFAFPDAQIAIMDAKLAAQVMYADADASVQSQKAQEFASLQSGLSAAAARGMVDRIVNPEDLRKYLIASFDMLLSKSNDAYDKKHGTK